MKRLNYLFRLFNTIRHLRIIQLYYQVWYRIKNQVLDIGWYKRYLKRQLFFLKTDTDRLLYVSEACRINGYSFTFLGQEHQFDEKIDWNFSQYGKLWNYNLQYLHYLLDDGLPVAQRKQLLEDISGAILSGKLPLEPYPVSLRIVNTILFLQRTSVEDEQIERALLHQIDYLDNNLEYHLLANHLLENIFALFIAAQYLKDQRLSSKYEKLILKQLKEQILSDGGHYECSPMYQSILLAKLLLCIEVGMQSELIGSSVLGELRKNAAKMLGWMQAYSFPDGTWALFNDAAEGIAPTTRQLNEASAYLNITAEHTVLNDSGFRKISMNDGELIIKTGEIQPHYQPGHAHADIGSFCLWYQGLQYIIDPGISTYTVSEQRSWERSTAAHNTVSIGTINQSDVWGGFRVGERAIVDVDSHSPNDITLVIRGYGRRKFTVQRSFICEGNALQINDSIKSVPENCSVEARGGILFHPAITFEKTDSCNLRAGKLSLTSKNGNLELRETKIAFQYNQLQSARKISYAIQSSANITVEFQ